MAFETGQKVKFFRPHDRQHALTGVVTEANDEEVLITSEPDGVPIWVPASEVQSAEE